jgi:hypothetical protein
MASDAELRALIAELRAGVIAKNRTYDIRFTERQRLAMRLESILASQGAEAANIKAAIARLWSAYPIAGYARSDLRVVFQLLGEEPPDPDEPEQDSEPYSCLHCKKNYGSRGNVPDEWQCECGGPVFDPNMRRPDPERAARERSDQ